MNRKRIVVLLSGNGSTLQALIDQQNRYQYDIVGVLSNRSDAFGLIRAQAASIPDAFLEHKDFPDRAAFDQQFLKLIDSFQPDFIVLAGYMRILSDNVVRHFSGRMVNIHPSLLPRHKGLHTYQSVLDAGDQEHGTTVHFVTEKLDSGAHLIQASLPINSHDTAKTLEERVKRMEQLVYPKAVDWLCSGRIQLSGTKVLLDNEPLPKQGYLIQEQTLDQQCPME